MSGYLRKMARKQMRANKGLMNRVVRGHEDVLQNIEAALAAVWRQNDQVDDRLCHAAIESALTGQAASHPIAALLADRLAAVRRVRHDVSDADWQDALRVVAQSIRRHSTRTPGEFNYLAFIDVFMA